MEFNKCPKKKSGKEFQSGQWRLASVNDVESNLEKIKKDWNIGPKDVLQLLDGYVDVECIVREAYRPNLNDMLLVQNNISGDSEIYSGVKLSREGRKVALLLSCEDRITQVILFVLRTIVEEFKEGRERQMELDGLMESLKEKFLEGRTVMHYAAEDQSHKKENAKNTAKDIAELLVTDFERGKQIITAADKYGTTALHLAAFNSNLDLCKYLIDDCHMKADEEDQNGENLLHFAVRGKTSKVFKELCELRGVKETIDSRDAQGKTALQKAAAKEHGRTMVKRLTEIKRGDNSVGQTGLPEPANAGNEDAQKRAPEYGSSRVDAQPNTSLNKAVDKKDRGGDLLGQTALHEAARVGDKDTLKHILELKEFSPLVQDCDGKTALHYAVQLSERSKQKGSEGKAIAEKSPIDLAKLLLNSCESVKERSLLLRASAVGIGTAEASAKSADVRKYLEDEIVELKKIPEANLLASAIELQQYNMARDFVNRGADLDLAKIDNSHPFLEEIKRIPERGRDQPTIDDGLGRQHFAEGLAALFLNPFVKSPVTVGILGHWGIGKSSLMIQTESLMLKTAAQLLFPNLSVTEDFPGSIKFKLSVQGERKCEKIKRAVKDLMNRDEDPLFYFLDKYQEKYHELYRALALMDRKVMFHKEKSKSSNNRYSLANIPSILTVRYNAWQYQSEKEAWAGLAVEIPRAIEESMTTAQRLRFRYQYAWKEHRDQMIFEFFLPFLLAVVLSVLVASTLLRLFSSSKGKELIELKYGSIAVTIIIAVWTVMKQFISVVKPIGTQIMGYLSLPDHRINMGYQNQVISDIKFSKKQLGEKPSRFWRFIAWLWCFFGLRPDNVKDTSVPKSLPPCEDDIRIIVFVDDLDRCKDTVILQVLSAVNLVLAACEINVILGMDKEMIIRAIAKQYNEEKDAANLAEKYLSKIVHLPLALPDSSNNEIEKFVKQQLGQDFQGLCDGDRNSNIGERDTERTKPDGGGCHYAVNIDGNGCQCDLHIFPCCNESCPGLSSKLVQIFRPVFRFTKRLFGLSTGLKDKEGRRQLSTPLKMMMLLPSYTPEERDAITRLSKVAADSGRLPREWKRFLTYHRMAWNILSQSEQVRKCAGWQVKLLVWIFFCWQWKDQINEIIKNWHNLVPLNDENAEPDEEEEDQKKKQDKREVVPEQEEDDELVVDQNGLRNIIEHFMEEKRVEQKEVTKTNVKEEAELKEEGKKQTEKWKKLKNILINYDVSMECIQAFQQFRLHCEMQNLPPPSINRKKKKKVKV